MRRRIERDPDDAVFLLRMKDVGAGLERRRLIGMRGNEDAFARGVVGPVVIWADNTAVAHLAERELGAAMNAEVFPSVNAVRIAPEHYVATEQTHRQELTWL